MSLLDLLGLTRVAKDGTEVKPTRKLLNFIGAAVTVADNPSTGTTDVTVTASTGEVAASGVTNDSGVAGANVAAALNTLDAAIAGGGGAALSNAAPQSLGTASAGVGTEASRADHVHAHGDQAGGTLHAAASGAAAGFMTAAQHDKLAGIEALADVTDEANVRAALALASANIAVNAKRVTNAADPVDAQDLATRAYVLSSVGTGAAWTNLIDLNLRNEAAFTFVNGAQTWNGLTWYGLNIAGNTDQFAVVPGTGIVLDHNASSTDWWTTVNTSPRIYLPFSQIPSFKLGRTKVRIWAHITAAGLDANYETAKFGFETIPYASTQRRLWTFNLPQTGIFTAAILDNGTSTGVGDAPSAATARVGMIEIDTRKLDVEYWAKVPAAASSDPNSVEFTEASVGLCGFWRPSGAQYNLDSSRIFAATTGDNLCAVFGLQTVNTSNSAIAYLHRLRIQYQHT